MAFIFLTALLRVVFRLSGDSSGLANFSPLGAMALFGGAYFDRKWKAFSFPLGMLFLSDLVLHLTVFQNMGPGLLYGGWYWVYGSFALMVVAGRNMLRKRSFTRFLLSVVVCVLIHWIGTDTGVWIGSRLYTQDIPGYLSCLRNAIPFEWRFISGTMVYGLVLFGSFEWMQGRYRVLQMTGSRL